jgi:hypothetical protein
MLLAPGVQKAFDLSQESDKTKDAYGRDSVGQSLLLARRLVEVGDALRHRGWLPRQLLGYSLEQ